MILVFLTFAFVGAFPIALVAAIVTSKAPPQQPSVDATTPPSDLMRFCNHLFYWYAGLVLVKVTLPVAFPLLIVPGFVTYWGLFWVALGGTMVTFLYAQSKPREDPPNAAPPSPSRATRFATAFFWWYMASFLILLAFFIVTQSGPG